MRLAPDTLELVLVAKRLGMLRDDVVFVGGAVVGLLLTDAAGATIRPTDDADVIVEVVTRAAYYALGEKLRELGFREDDSEHAPICRWVVDGDPILVGPPLNGERRPAPATSQIRELAERSASFARRALTTATPFDLRRRAHELATCATRPSTFDGERAALRGPANPALRRERASHHRRIRFCLF